MAQKPSVVGVVGLGSVGAPLLEMLHAGGHEVVGVEREPDVLARVDRRMVRAAGPADGGGRRYTLTNETAALCRADVVFEAVPEDLATKTEVLRRLNSIALDHTVLVSTTVSLSLTRLAIASGRPARTLGLRLLRPPASGRAVDQVRTAMSCDSAVTALDELVAGLGLTPGGIGVRPGNDAMALVYAFLNRAVAMMEDGYADRDSIDTALRLGCGLAAGPLQLLDEVGLDTFHSALVELRARTGADVFRATPLLTSAVRSGALGRKSGQGFYTYDDLGRQYGTPGSPAGPGEGPRVRRVGVLGSGTMARGIAEASAAAGLRTVLVGRSRTAADLAMEAVEASLATSVRRGRTAPDQQTVALALLEGAASYRALGDCDLVIEATAEDLALKRSVFAALGGACKPGAVLATTTSSLSVSACAQASGRAQDVLGLHFFNPAPVMKLVELVRTPTTGEDALATARAFCGQLGKTFVECADRAGFIVNHLLFPYLVDAIGMLDRHDFDAELTDAAVERGFGCPMGPFTLLDTIGLDVSLAVLRHLSEAFPGRGYAPPQLLEQLLLRGCLGRKSGQGFRVAARRAPL